jgi:hypothetical protein
VTSTVALRRPSIADRWLAPAPSARLAVLRILVGTYAVGWTLARLPAHLDRPPVGFRGIGVVGSLDSPPLGAGSLLAVAVPLLGVAYALGWRYRVTGPLFSVGLLVLATLDSSWGQIFHTENLMVMQALIVGFAPAADARSLDRRGRAPAPDHPRYGWPCRLAAAVLVVTYVIAGLAKLRIGGLDWVTGDALRNLVAHDNLRKAALGDRYSGLGVRLVAMAWVFPLFAFATVAVELGAPVVLLGRRARAIWATCAWAFHVGVLMLMAVIFPYQLLGIAFAPLFRVERLADAVAVRRQRRRAARGRSRR